MAGPGVVIDQDPWPSIGGNIGGSLFDAVGAASPLGLLSSGLGLLKGVGGLFGSNKTQTNQSAAYSGLGPFQSDNNFDFSYSKTIDLKDPVEVAVLAGLIVLGVYAWKKVKA